MQLSDGEKEYAIFEFKARIIGGFALTSLLTIVFIALTIWCAVTKRNDLFPYFIGLSIFTAIFAIGFGIYIFARRKNKEKVEDKKDE